MLVEGRGEVAVRGIPWLISGIERRYLWDVAKQRASRNGYEQRSSWGRGSHSHGAKTHFIGLLGESAWCGYLGVPLDLSKKPQNGADIYIGDTSVEVKTSKYVRVDHDRKIRPDYYAFASLDKRRGVLQLLGAATREMLTQCPVEKGIGDWYNYVLRNRILIPPKEAKAILYGRVSSQMIRYPGGKGKLADTITAEFPITAADDLFCEAYEYREPFFGAGAIGMIVLESMAPSSRVWINDLDRSIYAMWSVIASEKMSAELTKRVMSYIPNAEDFYRLKELEHSDSFDGDLVTSAFNKIVLHQISFSGLGPMAGSAIGGRFQQNVEYSVGVRWNAARLSSKIKKNHGILAKFGSNLRVTCEDFAEVIDGAPEKCVVYADPPYWGMGSVLYKMSLNAQDHARLSESLMETKSRSWFLSYDDCPEVRDLYGWADIRDLTISGTINSIKGRKNKEVLIRPKVRAA